MKPSPLGSKLLSAYAIVFAGLAPIAIALFGLAHGVGLQLLGNVLLGAAIVYFGVRVFAGDPPAIRVFAALVLIHYLGLAASNFWNYSTFPDGSRAQQMVIPRILRGVIFAAIYGWYFLLRYKTIKGFGLTSRADNSGG